MFNAYVENLLTSVSSFSNKDFDSITPADWRALKETASRAQCAVDMNQRDREHYRNLKHEKTERRRGFTDKEIIDFLANHDEDIACNLYNDFVKAKNFSYYKKPAYQSFVYCLTYLCDKEQLKKRDFYGLATVYSAK